jgi:CheY-like chemotaxis protein
MNILAVDDKKDILFLIKTILEMEGHSITDVENGDDAIAACEKQTFDLILLDLMMEGKNGFTTLDIIRKTKLNAKTHVIALTAKAYDSDRSLVLSRGFNDHIAKPFRAATLIEKIAQLSNP